MSDLHVKVDATLAFAKIMKVDLIQDFNKIQIVEQQRERETLQVVQKLCEVLEQDIRIKEDDKQQMDIHQIKNAMKPGLRLREDKLLARSYTANLSGIDSGKAAEKRDSGSLTPATLQRMNQPLDLGLPK